MGHIVVFVLHGKKIALPIIKRSICAMGTEEHVPHLPGTCRPRDTTAICDGNDGGVVKTRSPLPSVRSLSPRSKIKNKQTSILSLGDHQ
jgi:hypothetical protein